MCQSGENPVKAKPASVAYSILHVGVSMVYFLRTLAGLDMEVLELHAWIQIIVLNEFGNDYESKTRD